MTALTMLVMQIFFTKLNLLKKFGQVLLYKENLCIERTLPVQRYAVRDEKQHLVSTAVKPIARRQ